MSENLVNAWDFPVDLRNVRTTSGELHVAIAGTGSPVVFIHGWPQTSFCWRKLFPILSPKYKCIALDLRGFGDSFKPEGPFDKRTCADDVVGVMEALEIKQATIVGHDIGARVAIRLALDHPEKVERLAILSGRYPPLGDVRWTEPRQGQERWYFAFHQIPDLPEILISGNVRAYLEHFLRHWSYNRDLFTNAEIEEYVRAYRQDGAVKGSINHYRAAMNEDPLQWKRDVGRKIDIPTLVMWGENDPVSPIEYSDGYHRVFTRMKFSPVAQCGHFIHEEKPQETANEIDAFISQTR